jgi:hypothetical protein
MSPSPEAMERIMVALRLEHRADRARNDEKNAGHLVMRDGSLVDSMDHHFLMVATRERLGA